MARRFPLQSKHYQFSRNWFMNRNYGTFVEYVMPVWTGIPCTYLEVGNFEGQSLSWMFEYVLTHPQSRAIGIDPHLITSKISGEEMEAVRQRLIHNTSPWRDKCTLIRGNSAEVLRRMCGKGGYAGISKGSVDLCMIDGDHNELAVLDDARHCIELTRIGGWLLMDDVENDKEKQRHVKQGVELFLAEYGNRVKQVFKHGYVECFERIA